MVSLGSVEVLLALWPEVACPHPLAEIKGRVSDKRSAG